MKYNIYIISIIYISNVMFKLHIYEQEYCLQSNDVIWQTNINYFK